MYVCVCATNNYEEYGEIAIKWPTTDDGQYGAEKYAKPVELKAVVHGLMMEREMCGVHSDVLFRYSFD